MRHMRHMHHAALHTLHSSIHLNDSEPLLKDS